MSDEEDAADPTRKSSRRDRFKGALARTKTKLSKKDKDAATTVDDFLASGSAGRPSISDSLSVVSDRPSTTQSNYQDAHQHSLLANPIPPPQSSPRRIVVPKIDVSTSQRYPGAQPLQYNNDQVEPSLLRPEYQGRSRSNSSLAKGRGRSRGLSVQFVDRPPIIIGEGGDEAETPPIEVGRAKARARSASPPRSNWAAGKASRVWNKSPLQYFPRPGSLSPKPLPQQAQNPSAANLGQGPSPSPGVKRVQTGMVGAASSPVSESKQAMDKEFEMSLGLSPATSVSTAQTTSPRDPPLIHAPKPIRPPVTVPKVNEIPVLHDLKSQHGTKSLRDKFTRGEGNALRQGGQNQDLPPSSGLSEERFPPPPGPPPGQRPPDEVFAPPLSGPQPPLPPPTNGYRPALPPASGPNERRGVFHPSAHSPTARKPLNSASAPPSHSQIPPPVKPPSARPAPDEDYTGWVPDSTHSDTKPAFAANASHFPGVDSSGKLVPYFDDDHDAKPEKTKKRWFRRGS